MYEIGKSIDKKAETNNATRLFPNNAKSTPTINNNLAATGAISVAQVDNKCSVNLFKKVSIRLLQNRKRKFFMKQKF